MAVSLIQSEQLDYLETTKYEISSFSNNVKLRTIRKYISDEFNQSFDTIKPMKIVNEQEKELNYLNLLNFLKSDVKMKIAN